MNKEKARTAPQIKVMLFFNNFYLDFPYSFYPISNQMNLDVLALFYDLLCCVA